MSNQKTYTLISGASSGIGKQLALESARAGQHLILVARNESTLIEAQKEISQRSPNIEVIVKSLDLSETNSSETLFQWCQEKGYQIGFLINNAGYGLSGEFVEQDYQKINNMLQLNIMSLTQLCRLFGSKMKEQKSGRILNVASTAAFQPGPMMSIYFASKAYVLSFSEALHAELAKFGVTVTTLCPGATITEFQNRAGVADTNMFNSPFVTTAEEVADAGFQAAMNGKRLVIPGLMNALMATSVKVAPRGLVLKISNFMVSRK